MPEPLAGGLVAALHANPLIPSPHWEPRCELCRLRRGHPEVYAWLTRVLMGTGEACLTQAEIADEVTRRTGERVTQGQVSHHKTRHLDPSLADAIESMTGHLVMMDYLAGMEPAEMAVAYAKLAMAKTGQLLHATEDAAETARLAGATAALAGVLQRAEEADAAADLARINVSLAEIRATLEQGRLDEVFASWVQQHYPDLEPLLAEPEQLKALVARWRAQEGAHA